MPGARNAASVKRTIAVVILGRMIPFAIDSPVRRIYRYRSRMRADANPQAVELQPNTGMESGEVPALKRMAQSRAFHSTLPVTWLESRCVSQRHTGTPVELGLSG